MPPEYFSERRADRPVCHRPLTGRQQEILFYIRHHIKLCCCSPSMREMCLDFGFASPAAAFGHYVKLVDKGMLSPVVSSRGRRIRYELTPAGLSATETLGLSVEVKAQTDNSAKRRQWRDSCIVTL